MAFEYEAGRYSGMSVDDIRQAVRDAGFDPLLITDPPGHIYPPHTHPETKLLAIVRGAMDVTVGGEALRAEAGDHLIIPGNMVHSAQMSPEEGCDYFWSEKLL